MTNLQKERIAQMRGGGKSYAAIAAALGVSENTVKSYCRRNGLGADYIADQTPSEGNACANCGKPVEQRLGTKRKRFCSDKCRLAWWSAHPEAMNRKAVYSFICPTCGVVFEAYGNARRKYCSRACYGAARRASDG